MRKETIFLMLLLAVFCFGCQKSPEPRVLPTKGDFSFVLPEGYTYGEISDTACEIRNREGTLVGGIQLADVLPEELQSDDPAVPRYLDNLIPGSEYFIWLGSDKQNPMQSVSHQFTDPDTGERRIIKRLLFVKEDIVYDLYFDCDLMPDEEIHRFNPMIEAE